MTPPTQGLQPVRLPGLCTDIICDFGTVDVLSELAGLCMWRVVPGLFHLDQAQA